MMNISAARVFNFAHYLSSQIVQSFRTSSRNANFSPTIRIIIGRPATTTSITTASLKTNAENVCGCQQHVTHSLTGGGLILSKLNYLQKCGYFQSRTYIIKRTKRGKIKPRRAEDNSANLEAGAYEALRNQEPVALHDERNQHLASLTPLEAENFVRKEHSSKRMELTADCNEKGERIVKLLPKKKKETSYTISPKIDQPDLELKIASIKNKAHTGHQTTISFTKKRGVDEQQQAEFLLKVKRLLELEGLSVQDLSGSQSGLCVKPLQQPS